MKTSRIIALIIAVAIGLFIATQFKENEPTPSKPQEVVKTVTEDVTKAIDAVNTQEPESNSETAEENLSQPNLNTGDETNTVETPLITTQENKPTMITLKTNKGDIEIALNAEKAPVSAANFIKYAKGGQYEGTIFHRVIPGFMIQGGGFEPGMNQKQVSAPIPNEANNGLKNDKYTIAMARTSDPHSATAQFFINATDNDFLNFSSETPSGWGYAVFGEVINGKEVVDAIEGVATSRSGPHGDVPVEDIVIESVVVAE